ncbi:hypothetical protein BX616_000304 [Lobosporangium transversale]|uniref:F-box domain-containing protein n=1 Tax=Lobosporangium transversale TaxID=64571 RepID=A0A1Y2H3L0_9FUNG|nr:hypothetical protein BCR41DRAFT_391518 [Lobosporangium transversale]KAF9907880.1 hypothetical protein BX616_000304 [Lobosporangium transversale]ORZ29105.1 hypothetical protein BCR41DRAFT_391518 [Lobosporangium transversale]|eukprot:XP_021886778.1 hypothetical protein BCR41DRAFT_391518 [Lobosporangium transversale]
MSSSTFMDTKDVTSMTYDQSLKEFSAHLPTEIILLILIHLDHRTFLSATLTCRRWYLLAKRYQQYLWRHLALRDYSFTAARGLWKLGFLKDRELRLCFPRSATVAGNKKQAVVCKGGDSQLLNVTASGRSYQKVSSEKTTQQYSPVTSGSRLNENVFSVLDNQTVSTSDQKGKQRANESIETNDQGQENIMNPDQDNSKNNEDNVEEQRLDHYEENWKALYQLTSNWYQGRAKGYCPLVLPSITTLSSATQALSGNISHSSISSVPAGSSSESTSTYNAIKLQYYRRLSTPAQRGIYRILKKRKPSAVVGLQHEGSALTALSLARYPKRSLIPNRICTAVTVCGSEIALIRSNPHYREKRTTAHQQNPIFPATDTNGPHTIGGHVHSAGWQRPNIMAQDPLEHDRVVFALRHDRNSDGILDTSLTTNPLEVQAPLSQQQHVIYHEAVAPTGSSDLPPVTNSSSAEPANDILCHYSSPLHSLLVTGHMDGSVRLWDMAIQDPEQQCIRHWQTGGRRRVLCVGMNSKVVVCGNADSTLCVWDIHPGPGSSSSSYGTIHSASYIASTAPPGLDYWVSGIEHICVGDSLVACSTEFSGSVLVFSLATGSLVYEIPGLYQPSKMCMTDFFLLTGGRGAWSQGERARGRGQYQQQQQTTAQRSHLRDAWNDLDQRSHRDVSSIEEDEHMSCCINVWDLRTGERLYSLIPRLPTQNLYRAGNIASILENLQLEDTVKRCNRKSKVSSYGRHIQTTTHASDMSVGQHNRFTPTDTWDSRNLEESTHLNDSGDHAASSSSSPADDSAIAGQQVCESLRARTRPSQSSVSPSTSISVPLTLLDIAVTADHSTLVATLCERSGEGREGVYCWDFSGSRLEGYHEQGSEILTAIMEEGCDSDDTRKEYDKGKGISEYPDDDSAIKESNEDDLYSFSDDEVNNNMIMQQVDSSTLRSLHQARITGKIWIGWKMDEREFQERQAAYHKQKRKESKKTSECAPES